MAIPIWKDTYLDVTSYLTDGRASFTIKAGGTAIYTGTVTADPDGNARIRLNDIVADYMPAAVLPAIADGLVPFRCLLTVTVEVPGMTTKTYTFVNDWSYDDSLDQSEAQLLNDPVRPLVDLRMPVLAVANAEDYTIEYTYHSTSGTSSGDDVTDDENQAFGVTPEIYGGEPGTLEVNGLTYRVEDTCRRYALYYVNAFGGWDSLLLREVCTLTDGIARHTHKREYDNSQAAARGTVNHANSITRRWQFHTDTLTDDEASRMYHLLESTQVYLYDLLELTFTPLVLTGSECVYKTYRNQGRKRATYVIDAEVARDFIRR